MWIEALRTVGAERILSFYFKSMDIKLSIGIKVAAYKGKHIQRAFQRNTID